MTKIVVDPVPKRAPEIDRIEIYVRYLYRKTGAYGIFEAPCDSIADAADRFAEDQESVCAFRIAFASNGRPVAMSDATDEVRAELIARCERGDFETCPHPMVADIFDEIIEEAERAAEEDREHERIERAMLRI